MNVLSLFDGCSIAQQALKQAGFKVNKYFASEIDKYAMTVTQMNFPKTIRLGDVRNLNGHHLPKIDLLIGGSPCQGFSFAGKQLNFDDPRSKLFFEYVRILSEVRPKWFLLENVKMKKEYQDIISYYLGVEPIEINSNLVSAQNRRRLYWTNIPIKALPKDQGILLKDIVHEYVDLESSPIAKNGKAHTLTASYSKVSPLFTLVQAQNSFEKKQRTGLFEILKEYIVPFDKTLMILDKEVQRGKVGYFRKDSQANRVYFIHGKAVTLTGESGGGAAKMGQYLFGHVSKHYLQYDLTGKGHKSQDQRAYFLNGKHGTIPAQGGESKCKVLFGTLTPDRVNKRQNGQRFNDGQKFYTLTAQDRHGVLIEGYIRKLTPIECERLQTLPDNYTAGVSNSQRYKMLGNGFTCSVIEHILRGIKNG